MKLSLVGVEVLPDTEPTPALPASAGITWSPQQLAVYAAVLDPAGGSLRVDAVAGAGKTTTLIHACTLMQGRVAFAAFNKRIADEIKSRVRQPNVTCGTLHSFGLRAWKLTAPDANVDGDKLYNLCIELNIPYWARTFTCFMVSMAKQHGYKYPVNHAELNVLCDHFDAGDKLGEGWDSDPDRDKFEYVNGLLKASIDTAHTVIDFDDMLYMPLFYGEIRAEYNWILLDEAQDTNRIRALLVAEMLLPNGRVCVVGDEHQAIYGFTGADAAAMSNLESAFQCTRLPLTITYRCPKAVVAHAQRWVSHIQAADTAPEGVVCNLSAADFDRLGAADLGPTDVVLCRLTKPLISQALRLIRRGIPCRVEGRDIGQSLLVLVNRWKTADSFSKLQDRLETYRTVEVRKHLNRNQRAKAAQIEDRVDSLRAIMDSLGSVDSLPALRSRINTLFGDTAPGVNPAVCTLSTVHKAKGREWDRVYLLGRVALMPSQYAKQDWELQQEANLIYVAITRAKRELVEVEYVG